MEKKCHSCYESDNHIATAGPRETNYSVFHLQKICWNDTKRKGFKSSEAKDIVFNVYSLEHHRAQANTVMGNAEEISFAKTYHMTNIQPKSMFWYVTNTNQKQQPSDYKHPQSNQESAIYILQTIKVNNQDYSLFYDTGCCDMVSRYAAIKSIGSRAKQESSIPISIGGVGNTEVKSNHGVFQVKLLIFNGSEATFSGVCLDQITVTFPQYPLKEIVEGDIAAGYKRQGNNPRYLPQLP